jgi:ferredoxin-thioredoxin reductase catalytic chain
MSAQKDISIDEINTLHKKLDREAEQGGYHLNPEVDFTQELIKGLLINGNRYGYWACPCRLATGTKADDLDIICPCDYRDSDLTEYDACYCGLYVSKKVFDGMEKVKPIPERRPPEDMRLKEKSPIQPSPAKSELSVPVWRCKVCGYLCARDEPPEVCPICKAKKERFERFM